MKNVTADYPPTLFIHGTDDLDVPYAKKVDRHFKKGLSFIIDGVEPLMLSYRKKSGQAL